MPPLPSSFQSLNETLNADLTTDSDVNFPFKFLSNFMIYDYYTYVCVVCHCGGMHGTEPVWRSEEDFLDLVLSSCS